MVVGGVCKVIFMSNLTTVLMLCCVVVGFGTISVERRDLQIKENTSIEESEENNTDH